MRIAALTHFPAALKDIAYSAQFATAPAISVSFHPSPPIFWPALLRRIALPPFDSTISVSVAISPLRRRGFLFATPPPSRAESAASSETNATPSNPVASTTWPAMVTLRHPSTFCKFRLTHNEALSLKFFLDFRSLAFHFRKDEFDSFSAAISS